MKATKYKMEEIDYMVGLSFVYFIHKCKNNITKNGNNKGKCLQGKALLSIIRK